MHTAILAAIHRNIHPLPGLRPANFHVAYNIVQVFEYAYKVIIKCIHSIVMIDSMLLLQHHIMWIKTAKNLATISTM